MVGLSDHLSSFWDAIHKLKQSINEDESMNFRFPCMVQFESKRHVLKDFRGKV